MGTVLDSILDGVREDVAAREAVIDLESVKKAALSASDPLDALKALRDPGAVSYTHLTLPTNREV